MCVCVKVALHVVLAKVVAVAFVWRRDNAQQAIARQGDHTGRYPLLDSMACCEEASCKLTESKYPSSTMAAKTLNLPAACDQVLDRVRV